MNIKMLQAVGDYAKGATVPVDDAVGNRYITAGLAEKAGDDGGSASDMLGSIIEKAVTKAYVDGRAEADRQAKHPKNARVHQGEYTNSDGTLDGLAVFGSSGGFLHAVRDLSTGNPTTDTARKINDWKGMQLKAGLELETKGTGSPSGMNEATDADGAVLVIPEFSQKVYERSMAEENFLASADVTVVRGNTMTLPALDDNSRKDGFRWGGVQGYWANEAENYANATRPKFRTMDLRLKKLYVISYVTDELLQDSAYALEQRVLSGASKELRFKVNDAMVNGGGAGMPQGILSGSGFISVAKETGQAANTILLQNIEKMWMRMFSPYRKNAVWLINQDCEQQLQLMSLPVGIAGSPMYQPVGGVSAPSYATLKGRPVMPVEFCQTLGTQGDIILTNWEAYTAITKGGVQTDMSMHVRFLYGEMAYRFTFRMDGQPLWDKALTPYNGTTTYAPTVALATRS